MNNLKTVCHLNITGIFQLSPELPMRNSGHQACHQNLLQNIIFWGWIFPPYWWKPESLSGQQIQMRLYQLSKGFIIFIPLGFQGTKTLAWVYPPMLNQDGRKSKIPSLSAKSNVLIKIKAKQLSWWNDCNLWEIYDINWWIIIFPSTVAKTKSMMDLYIYIYIILEKANFQPAMSAMSVRSQEDTLNKRSKTHTGILTMDMNIQIAHVNIQHPSSMSFSGFWPSHLPWVFRRLRQLASSVDQRERPSGEVERKPSQDVEGSQKKRPHKSWAGTKKEVLDSLIFFDCFLTWTPATLVFFGKKSWNHLTLQAFKHLES